MRLVDSTIVKEPGKTGSQWRIHYSISLPSLKCDSFKLTPTKGQGTVETLKQYPVNPGDCILGDRGFSHVVGFEHVLDQAGHLIVRVNTGSMLLFSFEDKPFDLLAQLKTLAHMGHLPKHDEKASRAWLYGKLFMGLIVEKIIRYANEISPLGIWPGSLRDRRVIGGSSR